MSYNTSTQNPQGVSQILGNQPIRFPSSEIDPTPAVEGAIFYNTSVNMFVMGILVGDTVQWIAIPTSYDPSFYTGRIVDHTMTPVTVFPTDYILSVNCTAGVVVLTLPDVANVPQWKQFIFKDSAGKANNHSITINPHAGQHIDGNTSLVISTAYRSFTLYTDGSQWLII